MTVKRVNFITVLSSQCHRSSCVGDIRWSFPGITLHKSRITERKQKQSIITQYGAIREAFNLYFGTTQMNNFLPSRFKDAICPCSREISPETRST